MSENIIFCYSGTGNCLDMAKNIAKELGDTDIVMMRRKPEITDARGAKRIGIIFPCNGGGLPGKVEEFIKQIQVSPGAYTFGVCQYSMYMGTGLHQLNKVIPLSYWTTISHQFGYIVLGPHTLMLPHVTPEKAHERSEKKAKEIAAAVLAGEYTNKRPPLKPLNVVEHKGFPLMLKMKVKDFKVRDSCIGCGQCAKVCPTDNIKIVDGKPTWGKKCYQCVSCLQYCPANAISLGIMSDKRQHYHNPNIPAEELTKPIIHID